MLRNLIKNSNSMRASWRFYAARNAAAGAKATDISQQGSTQMGIDLDYSTSNKTKTDVNSPKNLAKDDINAPKYSTGMSFDKSSMSSEKQEFDSSSDFDSSKQDKDFGNNTFSKDKDALNKDQSIYDRDRSGDKNFDAKQNIPAASEFSKGLYEGNKNDSSTLKDYSKIDYRSSENQNDFGTIGDFSRQTKDENWREFQKDSKEYFGAKLSDAKNEAKDKMQDVKESAKDLYNDVKEGAKEKMQDMKDYARDKSQDWKDSARDMYTDAKVGIKDKANEWKNDLKETAGDARNTARDAYSNVKEKMGDKSTFDAVKEGAWSAAQKVAGWTAEAKDVVMDKVGQTMEKVGESMQKSATHKTSQDAQYQKHSGQHDKKL